MSSDPSQFKPEAIDHQAGDRAVKWWLLAAASWFPIFTLFGFILAIKFFYPTFLGDSPWDSFGRIRPAHVNGVLFGFVSSGLIASMLYIMPRLCAAPMRNAALARWASVLWNLNILGGIIGILLGGSQGREYAELPWVNDVILVVLLLTFTYIVFNNLIHRNEKKLFVSLWYYAATFLIFPVVYIIGNVMWRPPEGALNGTIDAIFNWYYGHNVLGLWFTTMGVPAMYFFIARIIKRPVYSHMLSLITFFTLAFFYTGVGAHHLLQAPLPEWLKTWAVTMSVLMSIPIIAFVTNILLTLRGSWNRVFRSAPLSFFVFGFLAYIIVSFQGSFQGLETTNAFLHFSQWPVGHAHLALLGAFGFISIGAMYWLIPRVTGHRIYSLRIMNFNFWLAAIGFVSFFIAMTGAGLQQNSNWFTHINVVESLTTIKIWFVFRAMAGGVVVLSAFVLAYNIFMTVWGSHQAHEEEILEELREARTDIKESDFQRRSQRGINLSIVTIGGVSLFVIMTFMVVAMPYMYTANEPGPRAVPLTDQQQRGLVLYKTLGCVYCHNQFVRPQDWAMGSGVSNSGDFYYSVPNLLGTERTGPSLSQIGGKRPTQWHIQHDTDPRSVSPSSIMPPFDFLSTAELTDLISYIQTLGTEDLTVQAFQPVVPAEFADASNPNAALMAKVIPAYDTINETYSGDPAAGQAWGEVFDKGKELYVSKCSSCHGCSGNGQGSYARQLVTRPANVHERMINYPVNKDAFHFWRIHEGVPGTGMPPWGLSQNDTDIFLISTYESSFENGAIRSISGDVSDGEGDDFDAKTHPKPLIAGNFADFQRGQAMFNLYCAQCHGTLGHGDGPASVVTSGGYVDPQPANFEESGNDFKNYGRWLWKVKEGVETTNMPPWKFALSDNDMYQLVFYVQTFSKPENYNMKWAPLYSDSFAQNLKR